MKNKFNRCCCGVTEAGTDPANTFFGARRRYFYPDHTAGLVSWSGDPSLDSFAYNGTFNNMRSFAVNYTIPFPIEVHHYDVEYLSGYATLGIPASPSKVTLRFRGNADPDNVVTVQQLASYDVFALKRVETLAGNFVFPDTDLEAHGAVAAVGDDWVGNNGDYLLDVTAAVQSIHAQPGFVVGTHFVVILLRSTSPFLDVLSGSDPVNARRLILPGGFRYDP